MMPSTQHLQDNPPAGICLGAAADRWTSSTVALPENGESVEFVLEYRDIAMRGTYRDQTFRTRWSRYEPAAICEWRRVEPA